MTTGRDCSWPEEELVLLVRSKKQLHEPMRVEVRERNSGDAHTRMALFPIVMGYGPGGGS